MYIFIWIMVYTLFSGAYGLDIRYGGKYLKRINYVSERVIHYENYKNFFIDCNSSISAPAAAYQTSFTVPAIAED